MFHETVSEPAMFLSITTRRVVKLSGQLHRHGAEKQYGSAR